MNDLLDFIEKSRDEIDANMRISHLQVFLLIALIPEIRTKDLLEMTKCTNASLSHITSKLDKKHGLITKIHGVGNRKILRYTLTQKGKEVIKQIA